MKKCPYCAEEIQDAAIKCKHCHEMLTALPARRPGRAERTPFDLFVAFFIAGPFMLPMIWFHPTLSQRDKIIGTSLVLVAFGLLLWLVIGAFSSLYDYWTLLDNLGRSP